MLSVLVMLYNKWSFKAIKKSEFDRNCLQLNEKFLMMILDKNDLLELNMYDIKNFASIHDFNIRCTCTYI